MARPASITSTQNARLKALRRLQRRPRGAPVFLVEGHRQVRAALEARARVHELFAAPDLFLGETDRALVSQADRRGARVVELSRSAFESVSGNARADGLLATVQRWSTPLQNLPTEPEPLLVVNETIERPGNLGTIVRTACAAGATGVAVCDGAADPFHPDAVRGSVGALFHVPIAEASTPDTVRWLKQHGVRTVVATPGGRSAHWQVDLRGPLAVVVGSERHGVSRTWLEAADETARIPLPGAADSLNVAVAAGIVLFEAVRQRRSERRRPSRARSPA